MKKLTQIVSLLLVLVMMVFCVNAAELATADDSCTECGGLAADTSTYFTVSDDDAWCQFHWTIHEHVHTYKYYYVTCYSCGVESYLGIRYACTYCEYVGTYIDSSMH